MKNAENYKAAFRLPADDWAVLKSHCARHGTDPSKVIRKLLAHWVSAKKCIHGELVHGGFICDKCESITEAWGLK